jgi:hypothetical protein
MILSPTPHFPFSTDCARVEISMTPPWLMFGPSPISAPCADIGTMTAADFCLITAFISESSAVPKNRAWDRSPQIRT